jgi:hypothetical protein
MPVNDRERDLHALRNIIDEAHEVLTTIDLPQGRAKRAAKPLAAALMLIDDLDRPAVYRCNPWPAWRAEDCRTGAGILFQDRGFEDHQEGRKTKEATIMSINSYRRAQVSHL